MRSEGYGSRRVCLSLSVCLCVCVRVCVCVCVCVSVKSHLTFGASVLPENAVTYLVGNKGQKICVVFSDTTSFQSYGTCCIVRPPCSRPFFSRRNTRVRFKNAMLKVGRSLVSIIIVLCEKFVMLSLAFLAF